MIRYVIKFKKDYPIKFISHLDLMRAFQRAIKRANLPILYSQGFNPHVEISFATPLAVGTWSNDEYADIKLLSDLDCEFIKRSLSNSLPEYLKVLEVIRIDDRLPSLMSLIEASEYDIRIISKDTISLNHMDITNFINLNNIIVQKKGKNGIKEVDIKPFIYKIYFEKIDSNDIIIKAIMASGSKNNLNPELLIDALKQYINGMQNITIRDILKNKTYTIKEAKLIPLRSIFN